MKITFPFFYGVALYDVCDIRNDSYDVFLYIIIPAVVIGIAVGLIALVKKMIKKNIQNNAQGLYEPPEMLKKKRDVEPPEDLYGCPRPDDMYDEPTEE